MSEPIFVDYVICSGKKGKVLSPASITAARTDVPNAVVLLPVTGVIDSYRISEDKDVPGPMRCVSEGDDQHEPLSDLCDE